MTNAQGGPHPDSNCDRRASGDAAPLLSPSPAPSAPLSALGADGGGTADGARRAGASAAPPECAVGSVADAAAWAAPWPGRPPLQGSPKFDVPSAADVAAPAAAARSEQSAAGCTSATAAAAAAAVAVLDEVLRAVVSTAAVVSPIP